jgi:hypothetical protein
MEDILDDDKLNAVSLSDQMLYLRLLAVLNRQKSRDGRGYLHRIAATALADRERWAYAKPAYDRLLAGGLVELTHLEGGLEYLVPNWPERQGFAPTKLRRDSDVTPSPTPIPVPTPTPIKKEPAADAAPISASSPRGNGRPKRTPMTAFPEPFPLDLRAKLQQWAERNRFTADQVDFAIQTVADWAVSNDKTKASWVRTIQGAMRAGWALNRKPGAGSVKQENTRREYLLFDSPEWKRANDCGD